MARNHFRDPSVHSKNHASGCISNRRGCCRRAKRNSNKRDRQLLTKDLAQRSGPDEFRDFIDEWRDYEFPIRGRIIDW